MGVEETSEQGQAILSIPGCTVCYDGSYRAVAECIAGSVDKVAELDGADRCQGVRRRTVGVPSGDLVDHAGKFTRANINRGSEVDTAVEISKAG